MTDPKEIDDLLQEVDAVALAAAEATLENAPLELPLNDAERDALRLLNQAQDNALAEEAYAQMCREAGIEVSEPEADQLHEEKAELENQLQRLQAEFSNYRKRVDREKAEQANAGELRVLEAIFPVVDDLDRADHVFPRAGIDLVIKKLLASLAQLGVEPLPDTVAFDPEVHESVMTTENSGLPEGLVAQQLERGWKLTRGMGADRLLRAAKVSVAVGKREPKELEAGPGRCQEASVFSSARYIPCNAPATVLVDWHPRTDRACRMCEMCASHNVRNRSGRIVRELTPEERAGG